MKKNCASPFKGYLDFLDDSERKNYIENRVIRKIEWYNKRSISNKRCYIGLMVLSFILSSCIPVITLVSQKYSSFCFKVTICGLGICVSTISTLIAFYNFKELWLQYRSNCEILKSRLHLYFTKSGEYKNMDEKEAFNKLVVECEKQIKDEKIKWVSLKNNKGNDK